MYPVKKPDAKVRKKFDKFLSPDEDLIIATGISSRFFAYELMKLFPLAILLIGLPSLMRLVRMRASLKYILTNKRFLIINGIFSRKITTAPLDRITHVTVEQSFSERFFYNCGQLVVITAGFDKREIVIEKISNPLEFKILMGELSVSMDKNQSSSNQQEESQPVDEEPSFLRPLKL